MIFTFEPTAYELTKAKQDKQTPKQAEKEFQRQYKISLRAATSGKQTTGGQLVNFKNAARICDLYGQPVPDDLKCLIALYESAERHSHDQAIS